MFLRVMLKIASTLGCSLDIRGVYKTWGRIGWLSELMELLLSIICVMKMAQVQHCELVVFVIGSL